MMAERLTAEEIEALKQLEDAPVWMGVDGGGVFGDLCDGGYIGDAANKWYIRDTGKRALATYKAQRDLVLFIAEFELRLSSAIDKIECRKIALNGMTAGILRGLREAEIIYHECKQRIEPSHDE